MNATTPLSDQVLETARGLVAALEAGDEETATAHLGELTHLRETHLYRELGQLTRELHNTLNSVRSETEIHEITKEKVPEAKERLNYVIAMTEQAANRTLNAVEQSLPLSDGIGEQAEALAREWDRLSRREMTPEEFRELHKDMKAFLLAVKDASDNIRDYLNDALMAQDFQDLTGQVIRRVTGLVQEMEEKLVGLIRESAVIDHHGAVSPPRKKDGGGVEPAGPAMASASADDVVSGQDDVDDLLSSLGF
jgi:chemotaxis protein CheZ